MTISMNILEQNWLLIIPAAMLIGFVWRYFRYGSIAGSLLGGQITSTIGEIQLHSSFVRSKAIKVQKYEKSGDAMVSISIISRAALGASIMPIALSKDQARELAKLLENAAS